MKKRGWERGGKNNVVAGIRERNILISHLNIPLSTIQTSFIIYVSTAYHD